MCIRDRYSRPLVFGKDRLRERGSLPVTFYVLTRVIFSMTNGNGRIFKENQIIFCIHPYICLLYTSMANDNSRKFKENQIRF